MMKLIINRLYSAVRILKLKIFGVMILSGGKITKQFAQISIDIKHIVVEESKSVSL